MSEKGICKFCGKERELVKSHIIPRGFYKKNKAGPHNVLYLDGTRKILQSGSIDNKILCSYCDNNILGKFENEAYHIFRNEINNHEKGQFVDGNILYYYNGNEYNYDYLRKFFISILWRASISKIKDFYHIILGPYEQKALEILKGEKEYDNLFKILIFKISSSDPLSETVYTRSTKYHKTTIYEIFMYSYNIIIFVDSSKLPKHEQNLYNKVYLSKNNLYIAEMSDNTEYHLKKIKQYYSLWLNKKRKNK